MPIFQAWGVACNACGEQAETLHDTYAAARRSATDNGWHIGLNGAALCNDCDGEDC